MRVFVTGGSGFIASHCIRRLLRNNHSVVVTARSSEKGDSILRSHAGVTASQLSYVIVEDIAEPGAFDAATVSNPPFEAVIHPASPYHFNIADRKKDLLDSAIMGTTGLLQAIKKNVPSVHRVVITSSFAAMVTVKAHPEVYDETCWNDVTMDEALHTDLLLHGEVAKRLPKEPLGVLLLEKSPSSI